MKCVKNFIKGKITKLKTSNIKHGSKTFSYMLKKGTDRQTLIATIFVFQGLDTETLRLKPNDQHFVQLARLIGTVDFEKFFFKLGMTKADYDDLNCCYYSKPIDFRLLGLFKWRNREDCTRWKATFEKLLTALKAIDLQHYLCQVNFFHYSYYFLCEISEQMQVSVVYRCLLVVNQLSEDTSGLQT